MELETLPSEAAKVYLALCERSQSDSKAALTLKELSGIVGLSQKMTSEMLDTLIELKTITQTRTSVTINGTCVPFTREKMQSDRIEELEKELRELGKNRIEKSGLEIFYKGSEEGFLIEEIERRGYALTVSEAYLLGKCVQKFGPKRTRDTYRQMRKAKNPLPAVWASLQKGIRGKGAQQFESEPFTKVKIRDIA